MDRVLLTTETKKLINPKNFYLFSNETFFRDVSEYDGKIGYRFIKSPIMRSNTKYLETKEILRIVDSVEKEIYDYLNKYHGVDYKHRYWKIIVGNWIIRFVKVVYFRYRILEECLSKKDSFDYAYISKFEDYSQASTTTGDLWTACMDEEWNYNLFSKICSISFSEKIKHKLFKSHNTKFNNKINTDITTIKEFVKNRAEKILSIINFFTKKNEIAIKKTYLSFFDEIKFNFYNGQLPSVLLNSNYKNNDIDTYARKSSNMFKNIDQYEGFEKLIRRTIPNAIPKVVLENYASILESIKKNNWPTNPRIIFTSNSYDADDYFKIWAAEKIQKKNSLYIIAQHGLLEANEEQSEDLNEYKVCDYYLKWGKKKNSKDISLFNIKLSNKKINYDKNGKILIISRSQGYENEIYSRHEEYLVYNKCLHKILNILSVKKNENVLLRLKRTFQWINKREFLIQKEFPLIKIDLGIKNVYSLFEESKLVVFMYYSTGVLETLTENIPSMFYCPLEIVYLNPQQKKYLDKLNNLKIVSYTQEEFERNILDVTENVCNWWNDEKLQSARREFCNQYTHKFKSNPVMEILKTLQSKI